MCGCAGHNYQTLNFSLMFRLLFFVGCIVSLSYQRFSLSSQPKRQLFDLISPLQSDYVLYISLSIKQLMTARHSRLRSKGNKTHCFLRGMSFSVLLYLQTHKQEKNCEEIVCLTPAGSQIRRGFKEHNLITCESKVQVVVSLGSQ